MEGKQITNTKHELAGTSKEESYSTTRNNKVNYVLYTVTCLFKEAECPDEPEEVDGCGECCQGAIRDVVHMGGVEG